jgi:glutaredoxin-related protein
MCGFRLESHFDRSIMFTETTCSLRSNRAIQILDQHKATYGAFNVLEDVEIREGVKKFS